MGSWTTNTDLSYDVYGARAVGYNGKVYIVGGYGGGYLDTTTEYDPNNGYTTLSSLNTARNRFAAGLHGSTIIVAGGYGGGELNSVEIYDIESPGSGWSNKTNLPDSNHNHAGTVYGDYFYVFGGYPNDKVYKCDINDNFSWSTPISSAGVGRNPIVEVVGDYIWVIGGDSDETKVRKYNPSTDKFITGSYNTAPSDVYQAASCAHGTKIYIAGGINATEDPTDDFISYDTDDDSWDDALSEMPTSRYVVAGAKIDNNFYAIGGKDHSDVFKKNESYDLPVLTPPTNPGGDINPYHTRNRQ